MENGDEVLLEVEGQTMDFPGEEDYMPTQAEGNVANQVNQVMSDMDTEGEIEEGETESFNNNANVDKSGRQNVPTGANGTDGKHSEEEEGMQRFVDYIRKQGLVIVDAASVNTPKNVDVDRNVMAGGSKARPQGVNRLNRHQCEGEFAESEVTIYWNAVNPMEMNKSLINQTWGKRISSSSEEEGMDMSDEVERLEVDNLTIQTKLNDKVMQFIADNRPNLGRRQMEDTGRLESIDNREQQMQLRNQNRDVDQHHMQPRRLS